MNFEVKQFKENVFFFTRLKGGSYGLMVMTADFESANLGSIPSKT